MKRILWACLALFLFFLALPSLISGPEEELQEPIRIEAELQTALLPQAESAVPGVIRRAAAPADNRFAAFRPEREATASPLCDGNGVVLRGSYIFSAYSSFRLSERAG